MCNQALKTTQNIRTRQHQEKYYLQSKCLLIELSGRIKKQ